MTSLFQSSSTVTREMEEQVSERLDAIRQKLQNLDGDQKRVVVDEEFPESFAEDTRPLIVGDVEWKEFFVEQNKGLYSVHGRMSAGSAIREHTCPNAKAYIYLVDGRLINWSRGRYDGDVIVPPDKVDETIEALHDTTVEGWYQIPAGEAHWIQAIEDSHFVVKFKRQ